MPILTTAHLHIREFEADDIDALYAVTSDPDVIRYVGDGNPLTRELAAKWIEVSQNNYRTRGYGAYALVLKSSGVLIGWCGLVTPSTEGGDAEIIYGFAKSEWGKGYGYEVAHAMLEWGFKQHDIGTVIATIDPANAASIKIVQRIGFQYVRDDVDENIDAALVYMRANSYRDTSDNPTP